MDNTCICPISKSKVGQKARYSISQLDDIGLTEVSATLSIGVSYRQLFPQEDNVKINAEIVKQLIAGLCAEVKNAVCNPTNSSDELKLSIVRHYTPEQVLDMATMYNEILANTAKKAEEKENEFSQKD